MKRADLTEKLLDIKREKGWTWKYITDEIGGVSPVLIVGALLAAGSIFMTADFAFLPSLARSEDAALVAQKIIESVRYPFHLEGREFFITTSIGISLYPEDGADAATLIKNADTAMYHAKQQGKDNFQFFSPSMNASSLQKLTETVKELAGSIDVMSLSAPNRWPSASSSEASTRYIETVMPWWMHQ